MRFAVFVKGLATGLAIAAPVGPIGLMCIRRSLTEGRVVGLATGLGAATADAFYGCVAGFGLTAIASFLEGGRVWMGLLGGLFLCHLGIRTALAKPAENPAHNSETSLWPAYFSTFLLTIANPATILSFLAIFNRIGLGSSPSYHQAALLVSGVFIGSALWWMILSAAVTRCRSKVTPGVLQMVNRVSGLLLLCFGVSALTASFHW